MDKTNKRKTRAKGLGKKTLADYTLPLDKESSVKLKLDLKMHKKKFRQPSGCTLDLLQCLLVLLAIMKILQDLINY